MPPKGQKQSTWVSNQREMIQIPNSSDFRPAASSRLASTEECDSVILVLSTIVDLKAYAQQPATGWLGPCWDKVVRPIIILLHRGLRHIGCSFISRRLVAIWLEVGLEIYCFHLLGTC